MWTDPELVKPLVFRTVSAMSAFVRVTLQCPACVFGDSCGHHMPRSGLEVKVPELTTQGGASVIV